MTSGCPPSAIGGMGGGGFWGGGFGFDEQAPARTIAARYRASLVRIGGNHTTKRRFAQPPIGHGGSPGRSEASLRRGRGRSQARGLGRAANVGLGLGVRLFHFRFLL